MTAKEYLNQSYWLDKSINNKLATIMSLREIATKTTGVIKEDAVTRTRNVHGMQDVISKLVDLENEINGDIDRLVDLKREIVEIINEIREPSCKVVLEYRYLCYDTWDEIADKMHMHVRSVFRLHGKALKAVDAILQRKSENCQ